MTYYANTNDNHIFYYIIVIAFTILVKRILV